VEEDILFFLEKTIKNPFLGRSALLNAGGRRTKQSPRRKKRRFQEVFKDVETPIIEKGGLKE